MNENEFAQRWAALEPTAAQRRRINQRLGMWLEATDTSLLQEWLGLIKVKPITGLTWATVGACLVLFATPLGWLAFSML